MKKSIVIVTGLIIMAIAAVLGILSIPEGWLSWCWLGVLFMVGFGGAVGGSELE